MVHCFVEEFVDAYKVIAYRLFLECAKVVFEHGGQLDEEGGDQSDVGVTAGDCTQV